jgi:hypothetical protein
MSEPGPTRTLLITSVLLVIGIAAAVWGPRLWEHRLYRQAEAIAGVGAPVRPGLVTDARRRIDPGKTREAVSTALGKASFSMRTEGSSVHEIWVYYYRDGTMTIHLTDGIVQRIGVEYGPPRIPTSRRP